MAIEFRCPHCGRFTNVSDEYAGQTGPCAGCGKPVSIPGVAPGWRCPRCGAPIAPGAPACGSCGSTFPIRATSGNLGDDATIRMLIPVGRSGLAIAAGYAGLFAVLCFPAPIALLLGVLAIRDLRMYPDKHGMGRAVFGLVMGAIFTVVMVIAIISAIVSS